MYFEEEDGLVVLDYKTDKVYKIEELVEKYHAQLDYYGRALEQITGKKVKEKVLYSFTLGEACSLSLQILITKKDASSAYSKLPTQGITMNL